MEGVIATPHLGASTEESEDNCAIMAVKEIMDFIENGNITPVNYPKANLGVCDNAGRIAVCHKNIPNMITSIVASEVLIFLMVNKSKSDYSYTIMDLNATATSAMVEKLSDVDGVIKVR